MHLTTLSVRVLWSAPRRGADSLIRESSDERWALEVFPGW